MADKEKKFDKALRIVSTVAGFWRGGVQHPTAEVTHVPGTFTAAQAQQIKDEAELTDAAGVRIGKLIVRELTDAELRAFSDAEKKAAAASQATA